jgi:hypothetical protein
LLTSAQSRTKWVLSGVKPHQDLVLPQFSLVLPQCYLVLPQCYLVLPQCFLSSKSIHLCSCHSSQGLSAPRVYPSAQANPGRQQHLLPSRCAAHLAVPKHLHRVAVVDVVVPSHTEVGGLPEYELAGVTK